MAYISLIINLNMQNLLLVLLPVILSGLGFLVYKHPPIARILLKPLPLIVMGIYALWVAYYIGSVDALSIADSPITIEDSYPEYKLVNIDSLKRINTDPDSIKLVSIENRYKRIVVIEMYNTKVQVQDSVRARIKTARDKYQSDFQDALVYVGVALLLLAILTGLTFLFDRLYKKEV